VNARGSAPAPPAGAVVFLGPSLSVAEAAGHCPATWLPPARQGDLWRAVRTFRPAAVGLIDGVFLDAPAVWHREILWALSQGVYVFGAASMGALRAAELDRFGMRGIGRVYTAYRDGVWPGYDDAFEDDDEVAVIHAPAELGGQALSDAMVDIRDTLLAAEAAGLLGRTERDALAAAMKRLHFAQRRFARLGEAAREQLAPARAAALQDWLPGHVVARKRLDALEMLASLAECLRTGPPACVAGFAFERALVWERFVAAEPAVPLDDDARLVLEELRLRPEQWRRALLAGLGRLRALGEAPAAAPEAVRRELDALRWRDSLARRADLDHWMDDNAVDADGLERLLAEQAALQAELQHPPPGLMAAVADELRLAGRFAELLARGRRKQAAVPRHPPAGPAAQAALAWYAQTRLGGFGLMEPGGGWDSDADFTAAVWREYLFAQSDDATEGNRNADPP